MNIIDLQERLKDLPEEALMQEMQMPTGSAPQFLVLSELKRRKRMRDDYQRMQASDMKTVAEETITAAGMPQSGIMGVAQAMAPKSAIAQDTGLNDMQQMDPTQAPQPEQPMMMADGGYVKRMQDGGSTEEPGFMERLLRDIRKRFRASRMSDEEARWLIENYGVVPDALNPVSSAVDAMTAYNEGDYLGAGINALSSVPSGKFTGISANVAAELYNRYFGNDIEDADEPPLGMADGGMVDRRIEQIIADRYGENVDRRKRYADELYEEARGEEREYGSGLLGRLLQSLADRDDRANRRVADMLADPTGRNAIDQEIEKFMRSHSETVSGFADGGYLRSLQEDAPLEGMSYSRFLEESGLPDNIESFRMYQNLGGRARAEGDQTISDVSPMISDYMPDPLAAPRGRAFFDELPEAAVIGPQGFDPDVVRVGEQRPGDVNLSDPGFEMFAADQESFTPPVDEPTLSETERLRRTMVRDTSRIPDLDFSDPTNVPGPVDTDALIEDALAASEGQGDGLRLKDRMIKSIFGELLSEEDAGQTELPMDTGTPLEIPEDGIGSLLPPARQEVAPDIATSDAGAGTGAGAGAGGGGGAFGSIEDRIAKMLEERDRSAQADKWLALAQTGLALMSSTQPTIGGAIGEAGLAGIGAMRDARSQYDEDILKLLGAQSDIEQYKDARRLAAAKASKGSGASLDKAIDNARQEINMLYREAASYRQIVTDPVTAEAKLVEMIPPGLQARIVAAEDRLDALNRLGSSGEQVMFDATQTQ